MQKGNSGGGGGANFEQLFQTLGAQLQTGLVNVFQRVAGESFAPLTAATDLYSVATSRQIQAMLGFVEKANPASAFQFNTALNDLAATMGSILEPILDAVTGFMREYADVLESLKPAFKPFIDTIAETIGMLSELIQPIGELLFPAIKSISEVIHEFVVPAIRVAVDGLKDVAHWLNSLGLLSDEALKRTERTHAVGHPSYAKGIESLGQRTTLAALTAGQKNELSPDAKAIVSSVDAFKQWVERNFRMPHISVRSDIPWIQKHLIDAATTGQ